MPTKYTVTLSHMGTSSVIAIPKPIVDGFGLERGQKLQLIVTDAGIQIPLKTQAPVKEQKVKEDKVHE